MLLTSCKLYSATSIYRSAFFGNATLSCCGSNKWMHGDEVLSPVHANTSDWSLDAPRSWQVKVDTSETVFPRRGGGSGSPWRTCTRQRIRKVRIKESKKGKLLVIFYFFQSTSYSYRFNPMDYIPFCSFISLNYTYVNVFELVSDASYTTRTPPSLIQLYCSFPGFFGNALIFFFFFFVEGG